MRSVVAAHAYVLFINCFLVQMTDGDSTLDVRDKHWIVTSHSYNLHIYIS